VHTIVCLELFKSLTQTKFTVYILLHLECAIHYSFVHITASFVGESNRACMVDGRGWARWLLCFNCTARNTKSNSPQHNSEALDSPAHASQALPPQAFQRPLPQHDGAPDSDLLMPPKRKSQDTGANMERPEKKKKPATKGRKAATATDDGELRLFYLFPLFAPFIANICSERFVVR
jgi:hypothetical protein